MASVSGGADLWVIESRRAAERANRGAVRQVPTELAEHAVSLVLSALVDGFQGEGAGRRR